MARVFLALIGVILLAVAALALVWLLGQVFQALGTLTVGVAVVLFRLLWFVLVTGAVAGLVYFVASAWRPAPTAPRGRPVARVPSPEDATAPTGGMGS